MLAVRDPRLRERLQQQLGSSGIEFVELSDDPRMEDADVVVVRASALEEADAAEALDRTDLDDAPSVIVLGDDEDPVDQVRWVAAGASAVLDESEDPQSVADQLLQIAEAESEGGIQGPESGGNVAEPKLADFQSQSPGMRDFLDTVQRVAATDTTLLITGETGVGKERLARAIHAESERSEAPFVAVNCGALSESLLESELFGHERGAFTGAVSQRKGHFENANGGTIFLDEIAEMPKHLQVKLLTVLQRREVQRLGAPEPLRVDVRVIAATNRDLAEDVVEGRFREDLLFRLNVVSLVIPPLRERPEDIPWLVGRFLRHFSEEHSRPDIESIGAEAIDLLLAYHWPGNVREVVNVIERAVLMCEGSRIRIADLPSTVVTNSSHSIEDPAVQSGLLDLPMGEARRQVVEEFERKYLVALLRQCGGVLSDVARRAGINPRTLYEKMRRFQLRKEDYR